jgi:hypothetical protein
VHVVISNSLYNQVVDITTDYLGPASQRFIDRQIENHLHKRPDQLTRADITTLISWSKIALALLTNNSKLVNEYARRITGLK